MAGTARRSPSSLITSRVPSPLTANQSSPEASSLLRAFVRSKCSSVGLPLMSLGLAKVSPSAPEIGQRSQTSPPPFTGYRAEYLEALTGNGVTRLSSPSTSTVTALPSPEFSESPSAGSSPPAAGRPSAESAKGEGVAEDSGTRYGRQPSGKDRSPVCTS